MGAKKSVSRKKSMPLERRDADRKKVANLGELFADIEDALNNLSLGGADYSVPVGDPIRRLLVWPASSSPARLILTKEGVYHDMNDAFVFLADLNTPTPEAMQLTEDALEGLGRLFETLRAELEFRWLHSLGTRLKSTVVQAQNLAETYGPINANMGDDLIVTAKAT